MKEGWKYRKVGEVLQTISGGTPSKEHPEYYDGTIPWLRSGEVANRNITETELCITEEGMNNSSAKLIPKNSVVIAMYGATVGQVGILRILSTTNQAVCSILPSKNFLPEFLYFFFKSKKKEYLKQAVGGAQPNISQQIIRQTLLPIISIAEQERIVAELDLLTGIIDKQKAQLKELDTLAQSIFYDMFGDPVVNDRGWSHSLFKDVFRLKSGDGLVIKDFVTGNYPVYGGNGISGYHNTFNKDGQFIIIGRVGVYCGNVRFVRGRFWLTDNAFEAFFDQDKLDYWYTCYLLNTIDLHQYANQAAQPVISNVGLKDIIIILPPLPQQQSFAKKIEQIEQQKSIITRSIAETQKLFDYTMDKYFG